MKIEDIFDFAYPYYRQITDEELYRIDGSIPVITGRNQINYVRKLKKQVLLQTTHQAELK